MFDVVRSSYFRKTTAVALAVLLSLSSVPAVAFAEVSPDAPSAQQGLSAEHETPAGAESAEDRPLEDEVEAVGQDEVSAEESAEESSEAAGDAPLAPSEAGNGQAAALSDAAGIADDASEGESEGAAVLSSEPEDEQVEKPLLGFVYIDEQSPVAGSAQNIVVALSDEEVRLTRAVLRYFTLTGDHEVAASAVDGNAALFELENLEAGEYQITGFTYAIEGCDAEFHEEFSADAYAFEVQGPADSAVEVAALSLDGGGQLEADVETESAIEDALEEGVVARATTPMVASARLAATPRVSSNIVVAGCSCQRAQGEGHQPLHCEVLPGGASAERHQRVHDALFRCVRGPLRARAEGRSRQGLGFREHSHQFRHTGSGGVRGVGSQRQQLQLRHP